MAGRPPEEAVAHSTDRELKVKCKNKKGKQNMREDVDETKVTNEIATDQKVRQ